MYHDSPVESSYLCTSMVLRKGATDTPTYCCTKNLIQVFGKAIFKHTLCLGVEPSFRAHQSDYQLMTSACTSRYTNKDYSIGYRGISCNKTSLKSARARRERNSKQHKSVLDSLNSGLLRTRQVSAALPWALRFRVEVSVMPSLVNVVGFLMIPRESGYFTSISPLQYDYLSKGAADTHTYYCTKNFRYKSLQKEVD